MTHYIEVVCPRMVVDAPCEAPIRFELDYEPGDSHWGADADGNRGMYVPGYWYLASDTPHVCQAGHTLTPDERKDIEADAEETAKYYEPDDER